MTVDQIRAANWSGSIPVILSLAPTSLSSPTIPSPIHVLLPRNTFLHLGLQDAVLRLQKFAPPTFSFTTRVVEEPETTATPAEEGESSPEDNKSTEDSSDSNELPTEKPPVVYPLCWFEDEGTQLPLQWQFFAGVLWDSHRPVTTSSSSNVGDMPWKIRVHFTNYPSSQLLDLDAGATGVLAMVERTFKNSLKQSLVLQHGQNKVALNMSKQTQQRIWDSIVSAKYATYKPIQEDIQADPSSLVLVPIRLMLAPSKPVVQKRCENLAMTLGELLCAWAPKHFRTGDDGKIEPVVPGTIWRIGGVSPPLSTPVVDMWHSISHPDGFLYISLVKP